MEFLPTLYDASVWYAFFCLVTALAMLVVNVEIIHKLDYPFGGWGTASYLLTSLFLSFIFAPAFFLILMLFGETYKVAVIKTLSEIRKDD
jgi:hypothetical protein